MTKSPHEWLKQADYDMKTAEIMFDNKRYFYAARCKGYTFEEQGGVGMDKKAVLGILSRFRKALESKGTKIDKLILYGSYATGAYKEGSDIDVVVISKNFFGKDYWERIDILSDAI